MANIRSALVLALVAACSGMSVFIDANTEMCFMEEVQRGERVLVAFAVQSGGFLDIDVKVQGPDMQNVYKGERETEGDVQFFASSDGLYRLCFGNTMSTVTGKMVDFNVYVGNDLSKHDAATAGHLDPLERGVAELKDAMTSVKDHQTYMRWRERRHRDTADSNNARVLVWNVLENLVLVLVFGGQIMFLRQSFEKKRSA